MNRGRGGRGGRRRRPSGAAKPNKSTGKGNVVSTKLGSQIPQPSGPPGLTTPVLKPLYPTIGKAKPLIPMLTNLVPTLLEYTQYFKSNYSISLPKGKYQSAYQIPRFSDRYSEPLSIDPDLRHKADQKRLPHELWSKDVESVRARVYAFREKQNAKKMQELDKKTDKVDNEEEYEIEEIDLASDDEEPESKKAKKDPKLGEENEMAEDEEGEESEDEELDAGTDYAANYFDNGEDYLDEDGDEGEDGAVY